MNRCRFYHVLCVSVFAAFMVQGISGPALGQNLSKLEKELKQEIGGKTDETMIRSEVGVNDKAKKTNSSKPQPATSVTSKGFTAKPIVIDRDATPLEERLSSSITLNVRDMNVVDVLKFLATEGNFNLVTSALVQGRVTLYLKNVVIKDALDIVLISNNLAYHSERNIVHVMTEAEYQALYGKKFNDKNVVEIVKLNYAKPDYVLSALDNIKSALGRIIIDSDTGTVVLIDTPESIQKMKDLIGDIEAPLESTVYTLQYTKVEDVVAKLQDRIDSNSVGSVSIDERTNKLIVRAFPGRNAEIEELIKSLDVPTKEVLIEARVMQVVFKPQYDFGIDWENDFGGKNIDLSVVQLDEANPSSSANLFSKYGRIAIGDLDQEGFALRIRALKQVSDTKILSNPKLLVTNNEEAKIHVGDTVPYIISTTSGTGDNAITSEAVEFVDVGLKLNVLPTINDDGFITMTLKPELSTVTSRISSQGGGIPQVNKTLVETTVMIKDGMTMVMGGLKKDNKIHVTKGIPVLMDMPLMGRLFRSEDDEVEHTEIVIFITPHIVRGDEPDYNFYRGDIKDPGGYGENNLRLKPRLKIKQ